MDTRAIGLVLLTVLWIASGAPAGAEEADRASPLGVGDILSPLALEDQHGEARSLDASTRVVIFTREMDAGDVVEEALADVDGERLAEAGIVYVADVHRMPAMVRRLFALPSMRRRPYPMWLDIEGAPTAALPSEPGRPTLLFLEAFQVKEIRSPETAGELREALSLPAASDGDD